MAKEIKVKVFDELRESLRGALGFERGEAIDLRVTELPSAPPKMRPRDIREIRHSLNASQALFAPSSTSARTRCGVGSRGLVREAPTLSFSALRRRIFRL